MASFRFNLKNGVNSNGLSLIQIHISYQVSKGKFSKFLLTTGILAKPEHWLQKKQIVGKADYLFDSKNELLKKHKKKIEELLLDSKIKGVEHGDEFKTRFADQWSKKDQDETKSWQDRTVWKDWQDYINTNKNNWAANTLKNKITDLNAWKNFVLYNKKELTWGSINLELYTAFINWCYDVAGYKNSNIGRIIKGTKTMMEWGFQNDRHQNLVYKKKDFSKPKYFKTKISFTPEELWRLYNLKLISIYDDVIRDALCFSCFTGLRYSDVKLLTKANLTNGWLHLVTQKQSAPIIIPLNKEALFIIDKYKNQGNSLIPLPSDQKCNEGIHRILKKNNFDREIEIIDVIRKEKIREVKFLHEVFTFHCGKKTFITLFKKFGGDTNVAMSITGNTDENVIRNSYEDIDAELKREQMDNVWSTWRDRNL